MILPSFPIVHAGFSLVGMNKLHPVLLLGYYAQFDLSIYIYITFFCLISQYIILFINLHKKKVSRYDEYDG